jgi:Iap family predicted aminopeptidase
MWVKLGAGYSGKMFFGWLAYDVWCGSGHLGYNTGNGDIYGISSSNISSLGLVDNWKHYVFEMRSDVSYTNNKIYINTISQTISQQSSSENAGSRNFNSGNGRISGWRNDTSYPIPMNCSSFKVYNRALSSTEVTQNYNALRGRFGL